MVSTIVLRDLQPGDDRKGYLELYAQVWEVGAVSAEAFEERRAKIAADKNHFILVLEDTARQQLVGAITLLVEDKFIHQCGRVGHIEDVVVDSSVRGQKLGQRLLEAATAAAKREGCYKVILDCSEENVAFYEKCGLKRKDVMMVRTYPQLQK